MADIFVTGQEAYFNEDAKFFKDVYVYGTLHYDFPKSDNNFVGDVTIDGNLIVGILTVRKRLDVGIGGTVLRAIADLDGLPFLTGKVGIGSTAPIQSLDVVGNAIFSGNIGIGATTIPEQRLDVGGSVKIDENIYDSVNNPGKNGYQLARDDGGIRWIPLIAESGPIIPGISTDGIFVLDEGVPLFV